MMLDVCSGLVAKVFLFLFFILFLCVSLLLGKDKIILFKIF